MVVQVQHLVESRDLSRGMGTLIKYLRFSVSKVPMEASEAEAKSALLAKLQGFLEERMVYAAENIAKYVISTLRDGDVVLTFGSSPLVRKILLAAAEVRAFRLVVIDSRPLNEGLATLTALSKKVHCVVRLTALC
jgi:translation initiation factor eIF-2B subunit delta